MPEIKIPEFALVLLIGASGSGKSVFAATHFEPFETVSSDFCRGLVSGDVTDQGATADAFDVLNTIIAKRLQRGLLTVVDATNVQPGARKSLIALAKAHDVLPVAIVLDLPEKLCIARNRNRTAPVGAEVVKRQVQQLRKSLRGLSAEGLREISILTSEAEVASAKITRTRLYSNLKDDHGPFDVIGDVHGCFDELLALLTSLGYEFIKDESGQIVDAAHPRGRRVIFLGDLVDRGPQVVSVLRLAMGMTASGNALAIPGNHEAKLIRALTKPNQVKPTHGLAQTLAELAEAGAEFTAAVKDWAHSLISHYVLDSGRLVVAHAGLKQAYQGRASARVRAFCLYGDTTGESDEYGLPVRYPWANDYRGSAMVLYGHTPIPKTEWVNNTMCLDTGCVFGGKLSAMRYPEKEVVQIPAARVYCDPIRPLETTARESDFLNASDVLGKRIIETSWLGRITIQAEQAAGAFEVMNRFALPPQQLAYLPPTMSPVETSKLEDYLEHPLEAFDYFNRQGVTEVICEEKHMGSRAVVWVFRKDAASATGNGSIHTRTGRAFFDLELLTQALQRIEAAVAAAGLWEEFETDWLLLDAELLPWSLKSEDLLRDLYRPIADGARTMYDAALQQVASGMSRGLELGELQAHIEQRRANAAAFGEVIDRYAWPTDGLVGVQLAPFQVLASAGVAHYDKPHTWHLGIIDSLVAADSQLFRPTRNIVVDTQNDQSKQEAVTWWEELTAAGGEGMVVKPMVSPAKSARNTEKGLVQPGLKVRGRDYLRITYGADYLDSLGMLKNRNLTLKRSLALREYALGLEAIDRLVAGEPLWRRHEAIFAVLVMESEPTDPRL
ncbi:MAG: polynucleotide kinase-phosphatase [Propionibacteriaceae bacterium]|nr:polynucleotide kinase-phosphatase [Propionibacteriaceae bacterium]